jgi:CheY-like chemotaxis protein
MNPTTFKQVLIVDDNDDYTLLVQKALSNCQIPCNLKMLSNGIDLLDWLETNRRPSLIFLDVNMPVLDGLNTLKLLKQTDHYKAIPVIMLSISERQDDIDESYNNGANGYMIKPHKYSELKERMASLSHYWFDVAQTPSSVRSWFNNNGRFGLS